MLIGSVRGDGFIYPLDLLQIFLGYPAPTAFKQLKVTTYHAQSK
jgi:hypothetical protein